MTEGMRSGQPPDPLNGTAHGVRRSARRPPARVGWQPVISRCAAAAVVAVVLPLCLQRVFAGPLSGFALAGEPAETARALPPLATVAPLAGLAVRRFHAWPVVLGGLAVIGLGDVLGTLGGGSAALAIAVVGYGAGAGLAVPATLALAIEAGGRRPFAAWWVAVAVAALAVLPGLDRYGVAASGSRVTPGPWLTVIAIASVLLYAMLRERAAGPRAAGARAGDRAAFPPAERAQFAMLVAPAGALGLIALAVAYRPQHAAAAAAAAEAVGLFVLAAMMVRGAANEGSEGFAVACAALGLIVAPVSGALGSLWALTHASDHRGGALVAAAAALGAVAGAFTTILRRARGATRRACRHQARRGQAHRKGHASPATSPGTVIGLLLAAAALTGSCLVGPFAAAPVLAVGAALVTGGLTAAVAGRAAEVTTAGAMAGVAICLAGVGVGYLGEGAIQVQLAGTAAPPVAALGWWELAGAAVVLGLAIIGRLRQVRGKARNQVSGEIRSQPRGDRGAGEARPVHG